MHIYLKPVISVPEFFEPIEIQNRTAMYFCVYDNEKTRIWENRDIKFVSDVRRVVQSIMLKRIAKNSLASSYTSLEAILENTGCGIYVVDYHTHAILYMNHKFKELFLSQYRGKSSGKNAVFRPGNKAQPVL